MNSVYLKTPKICGFSGASGGGSGGCCLFWVEYLTILIVFDKVLKKRLWIFKEKNLLDSIKIFSA